MSRNRRNLICPACGENVALRSTYTLRFPPVFSCRHCGTALHQKLATHGWVSLMALAVFILASPWTVPVVFGESEAAYDVLLYIVFPVSVMLAAAVAVTSTRVVVHTTKTNDRTG